MSGRSILTQLEEMGHPAPRLSLRGSVPSEHGTERYEFRGELARGGMGIVHHGRDNDLGRNVALKVLHEKHLQNAELVQRFVEEAQIGGQLQHPGIVPVYELGLQAGGQPYFAMKLVKGETLGERLAGRSDTSVDRRTLLAVFRDVCRTMAYAHAHGVIHRDLKPANVMIGGFGEVQVVDWGFAKVLARREQREQDGDHHEDQKRGAERVETMISTVRSADDSSASVAGSVMGTPAYMSPEQALGQVDELDARSDVFGLGAILCEILTGSPPYTGDVARVGMAAAKADLDAAHAALATCNADARLTDLCLAALQPLPKDRPADAEHLAGEVAAWLAEAEGRAHRARVVKIEAEAEAEEQLRARRQTMLVAGGVVLVVAIAVALFLFVSFDAAARENERRAAIDTALQDAARHRAAGAWSEAVVAAELAAGLGGDDALLVAIRAQATIAAEQARVRAEDDELLAELEEIRGRCGQVLFAVEGELEELDQAYAAAYERRFTSLDTAADRLLASSHAAAFAANLTVWSWIRKTAAKAGGEAQNRADWQSIHRLARRLDPSDVAVHDALLADDDAAALRTIVEERGDELSATTAPWVGLVLAEGTPDQTSTAVVFLENQHLRNPRDFWIQMRLASAALRANDTNRAARHATAALAVRPKHAMAWCSLAAALAAEGDGQRAFVAFGRFLQLEAECRKAADLGVVDRALREMMDNRDASRGSEDLLDNLREVWAEVDAQLKQGVHR
jgi:eukaryotic-like serine/threonine-protein kinase